MVLRLAPIGLATGTAAGIFGIGGGFLIVPGLMLAVGMTMANATASSLVSVTLFGAATSANYAYSGMVDGSLILLLFAGGIAGAFLGILLSKWLAGRLRTARTAFALMILAVASFVAFQRSIAYQSRNFDHHRNPRRIGSEDLLIQRRTH